MENGKREDSVKDQGKEINFQWFLISFFIHWKWFILSLFVFVAVGWVYLRYTVPIYNVSTKVVLRDSRRGGLGNSELTFY